MKEHLRYLQLYGLALPGQAITIGSTTFTAEECKNAARTLEDHEQLLSAARATIDAAEAQLGLLDAMRELARVVSKCDGTAPRNISEAKMASHHEVFHVFSDTRMARTYRQEHGTGGWIFEDEANGQAILFPPSYPPSAIITHRMTSGRNGRLIGC